MRVALVTPGIFPYVTGGIQRHSLNLARHLVRLGVEVDLYHPQVAGAKDVGQLEGMSAEEKALVTSIAIPWPKCGSWPGHFLRELVLFSRAAHRRLVAGRPVDFIYAQGSTGLAFTGERARKRLTVPVGVNLHGLEMFQCSPSWRVAIVHRFQRPMATRELRQADCVFSFGRKIRALVDKAGVPPARIVEIPNAVPSSWIRDAAIRKSTATRRFVFIGRYERHKGIVELTAALSHMIHSAPFHFDFVGPIPEAMRLRREDVAYHANVSDSALGAILDDCDALVCPSHAEGMPTVILEAMARGLAVIATDVGAVGMMVDADNGILLPRPAVRLLAEALQKLAVLPPAALESLKAASLSKVRAFTWDRVARLTLDTIGRWSAA